MLNRSIRLGAAVALACAMLFAAPARAAASDDDCVCQGDGSSADANLCMLCDLKKADEKEVAAFRAWRAELASSEARKKLDKEERAWSAARDADCQPILDYPQFYGMKQGDYYGCKQEAAEARIVLFKRRQDCRKGDTVECGILKFMR